MTGDLWTLDLVQLWDLLLGVLLPLVIATVTRATWSSRTKTLIMLAFVFVTTVLAELFAGRLQQPDGWRGLVASLIVVFLLTVATYRHVWKPIGAVEKIEAVTTPAPRRALPVEPAGGIKNGIEMEGSE